MVWSTEEAACRQAHNYYYRRNLNEKKSELILEILPQFRYCSVLNNRPLLISIRGDIQAIKTQLLAGQYPCSLSKLIKNGNEDIKPKFELPRTKTVDLRQHWNFVQADVPNKNTGFLLRTLEYSSCWLLWNTQEFSAVKSSKSQQRLKIKTQK